MIAEKLLNRLKGIKETGPDRWLALCPAHDDRTPSLSIREVDDRLLLHCFAGCSVSDVVVAVGLELTDLFPENPNKLKSNRPLSRPFPATDVLRCLSHELSFIIVCASDVAEGEVLTDADRQRLRQSASRFSAAMAAAGLK